MWEQGIDWGDEDQSKGWDVVVVICSHHQWNSCKSLCEEVGRWGSSSESENKACSCCVQKLIVLAWLCLLRCLVLLYFVVFFFTFSWSCLQSNSWCHYIFFCQWDHAFLVFKMCLCFILFFHTKYIITRAYLTLSGILKVNLSPIHKPIALRIIDQTLIT
jgi:hypothetical protein